MAPRSAEKSSGFVELATKVREMKNASTGETPRYPTTSQVARLWEISGGLPRHHGKPLKRMASGATAEEIRSSFPVATKVATEVKTRKNSEPRKKRSAGGDERLNDAGAGVAMAKLYGSTGARDGAWRLGQKITLRSRLPRFVVGEERAFKRFRVDIG